MNRIFAIFFVLLILHSCEERLEFDEPVVQTGNILKVESDGVTLHGKIMSGDTKTIIDHGFVWVSRGHPTIENSYKRSLGFITSSVFKATINTDLLPDTKYYVRAYLQTPEMVVYGRIVQFDSRGSKPPEIDRIEPLMATWNDSITIVGRYFSQKKEDAIVKFGEYTASIQRISDTTVVANVPDFLRSYESLVISVRVYEKETQFESFNLLPPEFEDFEPKTGLPGTQIVILGEYFREPQVSIGGINTGILSTTDSTITTSLPFNAPVGELEIKLRQYDREVFAQEKFVVPGPAIFNIFPRQVTWGDEVTIEGENIPSSGNSVVIGGIGAYNLESGPTFVKFLVPGGVESDSLVVQLRISGISMELDQKLLLLPTTLSGVDRLEANGGDRITINGSNFHPQEDFNEVYLDDYEMNIDFNSPEEIRFEVPSYLTDKEYNLRFITGSREFELSEPIRIKDPWRRLTAYPGTESVNMLSFPVNGELYVTNPIRHKTEVYAYNIATEEWSAKAERPSFSYNLNLSLTTQSYGYSLHDDELWRYDPLNDDWEQISSYPGQGSGLTVFGFSIDDKIYIGGGSDFNNIPISPATDFWEYDEPSDTWTQRADFPFGQLMTSKSFSVQDNGFIYEDSDIFQYDPAGNEWELAATLPSNIYESEPLGIKGKAYIISGKLGSTSSLKTNKVFEFDPSTGQIIELDHAPFISRSSATGGVLNDVGYIGLGRGNYSDKLFDFLEFVPDRY